MAENSQNPINRPRTQTSDNFTFKSGIFQKREYILNRQKDKNDIPISRNITGTNNLSPLSNNLQNQSGISNKDHNPENNKFNNKFMASSSLFAFQNKNSVGTHGTLFKMARQVSQPTQQQNNLKNQIQKNKFSFLQVPKLNVTEPKYTQISEQNKMKNLNGNSQTKNKTPSFLRKETKSNYDPQENNNDQFFKKIRETEKIFLPIEKQKVLSSQQQAYNQDIKNSKQLLLPIQKMTNKLSAYSPINSNNSSCKNKSTKQTHESPSNYNFLDPKTIAPKNHRKSSVIIENEKDYYTPTQKNNSKVGSSNLIQIPNKAMTAKHTNKSQFLTQHLQEAVKNKNYFLLAPVQDERKLKTSIPSFIKFKEKRNQILKKSTLQTKGSFQNYTNNSAQSFIQKKFSLQDFQIKERLGKGAFGDVFLARQNQTGFFCVLKKLSKKKIRQQNLQQHILRQIKIQAFLNHKHLTSLYGFFDDQDFIYLILQYLSDGSLAQKYNRKKCPQKQTANYMKQVCEGLKFMHIQDIIHRDIKPQNIFVHNDYIKIGDFGCSVCSNTKRNTIVGCLAYISPEQLNNESYDDKIDVWSIGILCYQLLTGRPPFQQDIIKITRQQKQAKLSQLRFPTKLQLSDDAKDFTKRLLQQIPQNRMSINQALKHPFITKNINTQMNSILSQASLRQN